MLPSTSTSNFNSNLQLTDLNIIWSGIGMWKLGAMLFNKLATMKYDTIVQYRLQKDRKLG